MPRTDTCTPNNGKPIIARQTGAGMGCASSKVQQKPPEEQSVPGEDALCKESINSGRGGGGEAEESRPASPVAVLESNTFTASQVERPLPLPLPRLATQSLATQLEGGDAWRAVDAVEVGGETITYESGLQMRTPRLHSDRGLHFAAKSGDLPLVHKLLIRANAIVDGSIEGMASEGGDTATTTTTAAAETTATTTMGKGKVALSPDGTAPNSPSTDLNERGMWGNTPLLVATQYGHPQVALALIRGGANGCLANERQATALHYSCAEGLIDVSRALLLIDKRVEVDPPAAMVHHPGVGGGRAVPVTPLSAAAIGGHTELVQLLVEHGAQVDRQVLLRRANGEERGGASPHADGKGWSALAGAARFGHTETCVVLIEHGANFMVEDSDGRTPLMHAIHGGHEQTSLALVDAARPTGQARRLCDAHESPTSEAHSGLAPLHLACYKKMAALLEALLAEGARIEVEDSNGATPLLHACRKGAAICARALLARGADPLTRDRDGVTPLSAARSRKNHPGGEELIQLMEAVAAAAPSDRPRIARLSGAGGAGGSGERGDTNIPQDGQGQKGAGRSSADFDKGLAAFQVAGDLVDGMMSAAASTATTLPDQRAIPPP